MVKEITLTGGKTALIDTDLFEKASKYNWYLHKGGYAARNNYVRDKKVGTTFLHRFVCGVDSKYIVDHINNSRLDNRRENLRIVTCQQNNFNRGPTLGKSSIYKGVFWSKEKNLWISIIKLNGKPKNLGYFQTEFDAAIAYNSNAVEMFGGHAWLNDVPIEKEWWKKRVFLKENSTGFRGVTQQRQGKWQARITINGKRASLGYFDTAVEAAEAYNIASINYHGEKALLNQI